MESEERWAVDTRYRDTPQAPTLCRQPLRPTPNDLTVPAVPQPAQLVTGVMSYGALTCILFSVFVLVSRLLSPLGVGILRKDRRKRAPLPSPGEALGQGSTDLKKRSHPLPGVCDVRVFVFACSFSNPLHSNNCSGFGAHSEPPQEPGRPEPWGLRGQEGIGPTPSTSRVKGDSRPLTQDRRVS